MQGMKGEDIADDTCWVIKTHSPWCMPFAPLFCGNKVVTIVRNPLDVIISWLNLVCMANHNTKAPFNYDEKFPKWWDWWSKDCARLIGEWYKVTMRDAALRKVPTLWVRFEDLVMDPEPHLYDLMRFMLGEKDLSGTNAERRIKEVLAKGQEATRTYDLKASTLRFNAQGKRYNAEQKESAAESLKEMLFFFGYTKNEDDPDNHTGFFDFPKDHPLQKTYMGFRQQNQDMINWVSEMDDEKLATIQYQLSDKSKEVDILNFENADKACRPMIAYSQELLYKKRFIEIS